MNRVHWSLYSVLLVIFLGISLLSLSWRFESSNFGDLLHAGKPTTLEHIGYFFVHKDPEVFRHHPASSSVSSKSTQSYFFSAKYRPLTYLTIAVQNHFFDYKEQYYLIFAFLLHVLAAGMLFYFLQYLFSWYAACLGALFFACNQAVGAWLGSVSHQQYQLEILMFFAITLLLKKHLDSGKLRYLMISLATFFIALFFRETLVVFPLWAFLFIAFYQKQVFKEFDFFKPILTFISYSLFSVLYIVLRSVHYPLNLDYYYAKLSPQELLSGRLDDVRLFLDDVFGIVFFPGERSFEIIALVVILGGLLELFRRSTYKEQVIFFISSGLIFMWPLLFRHYDPRYLYLPLLFFIIGFLFLVKNVGNRHFQRVLFSSCFLLCAVHAGFFVVRMDQRMKDAHQFNNKLDTFLQKNFHENKMVCFLNTPLECFGNGTMEALCFKAQNKGIRIFESSLDAEVSLNSSKLLTLLEEKNQSKDDVLFYAWNATDRMFFVDSQDAFLANVKNDEVANA